MKFKLLATYIAAFWIAVFIVLLWLFKVLLQELGMGLAVGAVYGLVTYALWDVVVRSVRDAHKEFRRGSKINE